MARGVGLFIVRLPAEHSAVSGRISSEREGHFDARV